MKQAPVVKQSFVFKTLNFNGFYKSEVNSHLKKKKYFKI
jgi:hypothetical protein